MFLTNKFEKIDQSFGEQFLAYYKEPKIQAFAFFLNQHLAFESTMFCFDSISSYQLCYQYEMLVFIIWDWAKHGAKTYIAIPYIDPFYVVLQYLYSFFACMSLNLIGIYILCYDTLHLPPYFELSSQLGFLRPYKYMVYISIMVQR